MDEWEAAEFVRLLQGLIWQKINAARPAHNKLGKDDTNYELEIIELLRKKSE